MPWRDFKATYRGREKEDAPPLDLTKVARLSFMMRRCAVHDPGMM